MTPLPGIPRIPGIATSFQPSPQAAPAPKSPTPQKAPAPRGPRPQKAPAPKGPRVVKAPAAKGPSKARTPVAGAGAVYDPFAPQTLAQMQAAAKTYVAGETKAVNAAYNDAPITQHYNNQLAQEPQMAQNLIDQLGKIRDQANASYAAETNATSQAINQVAGAAGAAHQGLSPTQDFGSTIGQYTAAQQTAGLAAQGEHTAALRGQMNEDLSKNTAARNAALAKASSDYTSFLQQEKQQAFSAASTHENLLIALQSLGLKGAQLNAAIKEAEQRIGIEGQNAQTAAQNAATNATRAANTAAYQAGSLKLAQQRLKVEIAKATAAGNPAAARAYQQAYNRAASVFKETTQQQSKQTTYTITYTYQTVDAQGNPVPATRTITGQPTPQLPANVPSGSKIVGQPVPKTQITTSKTPVNYWIALRQAVGYLVQAGVPRAAAIAIIQAAYKPPATRSSTPQQNNNPGTH